jgi:hypothetical protein
MAQYDLIPSKPFSAVAAENFRRLAVAPHGAKRRAERENILIVKGYLSAELNAETIPVKKHRRVKHRDEAALPLVAAE